MKHTKKLSLILALIMLMTSLFVFSAEAEAYGDFRYTVLDDGTVEITKYTGSGSEAVIPEKINGKAVTSIGTRAFEQNMTLKKIEIPDTVTSFGDYAFYYVWFAFDEIHFSENTEKIGAFSFGSNPFLRKIYFEGMTTEIADAERAFNFTEIYINGIEKDIFADKFIEYANTGNEEIANEIMQYMEYPETSYNIATIYCHEGSTAESYAIENGISYELIHFFKGEWTVDFDNMVRTRKCIHCNETETEALEKTENEDVEIIAPSDSDTDFTVDEIESASDNYVIIKEALNSAIDTDYEIVKAFDINLTNKDGVHVQPDGTVKVKLPISNADGSFKVYRVNDDGTLTDMNAYREGSHMVFDTDHFSIYVVVQEGEATDTPDTPDEPDEEKLKDKISKLFALLTELLEMLKALINSIF